MHLRSRSLSQCLREKSPVLRRGRGRAPNISVPSVAPGARRAFILAAMCSKSAQPTWRTKNVGLNYLTSFYRGWLKEEHLEQNGNVFSKVSCVSMLTSSGIFFFLQKMVTDPLKYLPSTTSHKCHTYFCGHMNWAVVAVRWCIRILRTQ